MTLSAAVSTSTSVARHAASATVDAVKGAANELKDGVVSVCKGPQAWETKPVTYIDPPDLRPLD